MVSFETGQVVKVFDFPPKSKGTWILDERTLVYVENRNDVDNLWSMPLDGGTPKQLTKFTSDFIFNFVPSRDGKQFAVARGNGSFDVILIKDFR